MNIYIDDRQEIKIKEQILEDMRKAIKVTLRYEEKSLDSEVSISLVEKVEIQELNKDYRGVDEETDVLSFPLDEDFGIGVKMLGDIIISPSKALEQSVDFGHSFRREMVYLTVHSALHLLGYDHLEEKDKKRMRAKEKNIMEKLDILK